MFDSWNPKNILSSQTSYRSQYRVKASLAEKAFGALGIVSILWNCVYKAITGKMIFMINPCHVYLVCLSNPDGRLLRAPFESLSLYHSSREPPLLATLRTLDWDSVRRPIRTESPVRSRTLLPRTRTGAPFPPYDYAKVGRHHAVGGTTPDSYHGTWSSRGVGSACSV